MLDTVPSLLDAGARAGELRAGDDAEDVGLLLLREKRAEQLVAVVLDGLARRPGNDN